MRGFRSSKYGNVRYCVCQHAARLHQRVVAFGKRGKPLRSKGKPKTRLEHCEVLDCGCLEFSRGADSSQELARLRELQRLQARDKIRNLKHHPPAVVFLPARGSFPAVTWEPDFTYEERLGRSDDDKWIPIYEDSKGFETPLFKIQARLFYEWFHFVIRVTKRAK